MHTTASDGAFEPSDVLVRAAKGGLDLIAVTDHDWVTDVPTGPQVIEGRPIHVLAAAEMSGTHDGREFHLLVYFPGAAPEAFRAYCEQRRLERAQRYKQTVENLARAGVILPELSEEDAPVVLTRHHLARALVAQGHARNFHDAFKRFVGDGLGFVPTFTLPFTTLIASVKAYGALCSWAHPQFNALRAYLPEFAEAGLDGVEVYRPVLQTRQVREVRKRADALGLLATGGSDWHGWTDSDLGLFAVDEGLLGRFFEKLGAISA